MNEGPFQDVATPHTRPSSSSSNAQGEHVAWQASGAWREARVPSARPPHRKRSRLAMQLLTQSPKQSWAQITASALVQNLHTAEEHPFKVALPKKPKKPSRAVTEYSPAGGRGASTTSSSTGSPSSCPLLL